MRRSLAALMVLAAFVGCGDADLPTVTDRPETGSAISDGSGNFEEGNSHFFWLAPMVSQPDESLFGIFDPEMQPTVRIVCWSSSELPADECDPSDADGPEIVDTFTVGDGLLVESDHYKVEFDTHAYELQTSSDTEFTTYRIQVLTPALTKFGGPFVMGFADFQLGENGKDAKNLDSGETIGLVDNRTLPIRFRLDEGALEEELRENTEPTGDPTGEEAFCQINCSVTVIDPDEDTEASLTDEEGDEITAMLIPANSLWTDDPTALVIDELEDDGDKETGELCLTTGDFPTEACFRYELSQENPNGTDFFPDDPNSFVRFGICPEGQAVSGGSIVSSWRLLKADEVNGDVVITRPDEVDVTDFLQCDVSTVALWDGVGGELAGSVLQWLVPPVEASDFWGGQLRDLSDLFWGEDIEMSRLISPSSAAEGATLQMRVQLTAVHDDVDPTPAGREVIFERTGGSSLAAAPGFPFVSSTLDSIVTVETDTAGQATVEWTIGDGANRLEVSSPVARPAAGETDPVAFEVTGTTGEVLFGVNASDDGLSEVDPVTGAVTFIGPLHPNADSVATPVAMAVRNDTVLYVWNNSDGSGNQAETTGELMTVDRCTGEGTNVDPPTPGQGVLHALASSPTDSLFGVASDLYAIHSATGVRTLVGSLGTISQVGGAAFDANGTLYGLQLNGDPGSGGGQLVTIDTSTGAATVVSTLNTDVGTVGSIVFAPDGTLVGSAFGGPDGSILFDVDPATGAVGNVRAISGGFAPQGMGFTPPPNTCP